MVPCKLETAAGNLNRRCRQSGVAMCAPDRGRARRNVNESNAFRYPRKIILGMSMSIVRKKRLIRRLLIHHLPLLMLSAASVFLFYVTRPVRDAITRLSFATAYPALILIAAT